MWQYKGQGQPAVGSHLTRPALHTATVTPFYCLRTLSAHRLRQRSTAAPTPPPHAAVPGSQLEPWVQLDQVNCKTRHTWEQPRGPAEDTGKKAFTPAAATAPRLPSAFLLGV